MCVRRKQHTYTICVHSIYMDDVDYHKYTHAFVLQGTHIDSTHACMQTNILELKRLHGSMLEQNQLLQLPALFEGRCGKANRSSAGSSQGCSESFTLNQIVHLSLVTGCGFWSLNSFLHSAEKVLFSLIIFERSFPSTGLV